MEDLLHECGIAFVRLRKPIEYYATKYDNPLYALEKLHILMHKQRNRGQDGCGVGIVKIAATPGYPYISRYRSVEERALFRLFEKFQRKYKKFCAKERDLVWMKKHIPFLGEINTGHLRYTTFGNRTVATCHPLVRRSNWKSKNLMLLGNFNMTNSEYLYKRLIAYGQHPQNKGDTVTVMEKIGYFLEKEVERVYELYRADLSQEAISEKIEKEISIKSILTNAGEDFDGGYALVGVIGHGLSFIARDPHGIRPAYYYADDEVVVVASERPPIQAAFGVALQDIQEVKPAHALVVEKNGDFSEEQFLPAGTKRSCAFERIYFSHAADPAIYTERKTLGILLAPQVLDAIDHDTKDTVFTYIPRSAEIAFIGLMEGINKETTRRKVPVARIEKLLSKDERLRTFITNEEERNELVHAVYNATEGVIVPRVDSLVVMDDSVVRGTTLERSIIGLLSKLQPKQIIIVSSAPQVRYPDFYGIDMSQLQHFIAFRALVALLIENKKEHLLVACYKACVKALKKEEIFSENYVKKLYKHFTVEEIASKISQLLSANEANIPIKVLFQTTENLKKACCNHSGDWYFTGNYPTYYGNSGVHKAFANFMEKKDKRSY